MLVSFTRNRVIQYCKISNQLVDLFYLEIDRLNPCKVVAVEFIFHWFSLGHRILMYYSIPLCLSCLILVIVAITTWP